MTSPKPFKNSIARARDTLASRYRFACADFSYYIALNGKSGIVMLLPEKRTLVVSASTGYERIRVNDSQGTPIGTLSLGAAGHVIWSVPDLS